MSSRYTRLNPQSLQVSSGAENENENENDRLVSAFEQSDDDNTIGVWDDDRQIDRGPHSAGTDGRFSLGEEDDHEGVDYASGNSHNIATRSAGDPSTDVTRSRALFSVGPQGFARSLMSFGRAASQTTSRSNNDGVFSNITAKPDSTTGGEDKPPTYEEAAADATPPYWETTVMAPGLSDEIFIEGLPVGSPVNFAWNMMVSGAFQFVGFFLTYLLHTSHAAKQGSRAGLGFTLIQCGYYLQPQGGMSSGPSSPPKEINPNDPNDFNGDLSTVGTHMFSQSTGNPYTVISVDVDGDTTGWISTALMVVGTLIILKSVTSYIQARRTEVGILTAAAANSASVAEAINEEDTVDTEMTSEIPVTEAERQV